MPLPLLLLLYFVIIATGALLLVFPSVRMRIWEQLKRTFAGSVQQLGQLARESGQHLSSPFPLLKRLLSFLWSRRLMVGMVAVIVFIPVLIAFLYRGQHYFQYNDDSIPDAKIRALLTGERLVPPQALPPDVFTTKEVEIVRPMLASADRNWDLLDPEFKQRLLAAYQIMKERHGYDMVIIEGYRSPERQKKLASLGSHVTNAGAYQSYHQYGLAADSAFYRDGKIIISEKDPWAMQGYRLFGEVAEQLGLTWGGRWKLMDFGHVEYRRPGFKLGQP